MNKSTRNKSTRSKSTRNKTPEKKRYVLSREDISNIDENSMKDYWEVINNFSTNMKGKSYEDLQEIMDALYLLSIETGFLDKNVNFLNNNFFNDLRVYLQTEYCNNPKVKKLGDNLLIKPKDIEQQFFFPPEEGERPRSELLCNIMFLANTMAHLVEENNLGRLFTKEIGEKKIKNTFMKIKNFCMKELIKCRKNGEIILIEKAKEIYSDTDVYYIAIPGYWEPFSVHTNSIKAINEQFDELDFYDYNISNMNNLHTVFPLKVLTEKEKIIRKYMDPRIAQPYELEKIRDRLLWYLKTQDRFEEIKRGKREMKEEQDKKTTRNRKPEKAEKFKEINRDFLERLNEQLGGVIGPTMMDKFLNRASYSFEDFINRKLRAIANPFLEDKDLDESQMNKELLKIFIYIRMFSKISMINNSRIDDENSIELVKEALENYEKVFEFMQNNKDKNLSYEDMKKNIQNYLENNEAVKEEFEPELEEQQITESQEQNDVNLDWDELKKIDESIKDAKEKKANAKKSIEELKEWRDEINASIKKLEDEIDQLTQSGEGKDIIIKSIKELRNLIKDQKSLRREIKLEIKRYKLQKHEAKYTIKENRSRKGEIIDRL